MESFGASRPSLLDGLDAALRAPHPLVFLDAASMLAAATAPDPHAGKPFARKKPPQTERATLIASFLDVDERETNALLRVWAEMLDDDQLRRQVANRRQSLPRWLLQLDQVRPTRAIVQTDSVGDGDNILLGIETPGRSFTLIVYIDHNMGTVVKDAFAIDRPIGDLIARSTEYASEEPDLEIEEILLEDAGAKITAAVVAGDHFIDPLESDTWPGIRPLVEWMVRLMPTGGEGYTWREPTRKERQALVENFAASPHARALGPDGVDQATTLFDFAVNYGTGDPLRWSAVFAEIVLLDLVPRKIMADAAYLESIPDAVRAVIRYAHEERGIPKRRTDEALDAVDRFTPQYRELIAEPSDPHSFLAQLGALPEGPPLSDEEYFLGRLADEVGGFDELDDLSAEPLPDEDLSLDGVPDDLIERVKRIDAFAADVCENYFGDTELRTVVRRMISEVAASDPIVFRRKGREETAAAALCWIAAKGNDVYVYGKDPNVAGMMAHLGLKGTPGQRALPILEALGLDGYAWSYDSVLADVDLLTSTFRAEVIRRRDLWRAASA